MGTAADHRTLSRLREVEYALLFGSKPAEIFTSDSMVKMDERNIQIDVLAYPLTRHDSVKPFYVLVTSGMSDQRMKTQQSTSEYRREILQYVPTASLNYARRLRDMAWLPMFDGFELDTHHSIAWQHPATPGTPWTSAFFLEPIIHPHREFSMTIEGDQMSFLWHIPISDEERLYKKKHGANVLIDRMCEISLPWIFDEKNRPSLVK